MKGGFVNLRWLSPREVFFVVVVCFSFLWKPQNIPPWTQGWRDMVLLACMFFPALWHEADLWRGTASRDTQKVCPWPQSIWAPLLLSGLHQSFLRHYSGFGINGWWRSHPAIKSQMAGEVDSQRQQHQGVPGVQDKLGPLRLTYRRAHDHWRVDK